MSRTSILVAALLALLVAGLLVVAGRPTRAEGEESRHIVFLNITGEGPTARAWYKGAPPAGTPVQDALDTFAAQGYRVASVSPSQRPIIQAVVEDSGTVVNGPETEQFFIVLLERP